MSLVNWTSVHGNIIDIMIAENNGYSMNNDITF